MPILFHFLRARRLAERETSQDILKNQHFIRYFQLTKEQAATRLAEERARATALDEKTFKLTLSLTIGLTVLGVAFTTLIDKIQTPSGKLVVAIGLSISIAYILLGGFLALGAMRTLASYGYGTAFVLRSSSSVVGPWADALARQETANLRRYLRNEAAHQMLRNGFISLLITLVVFAVFFGSALVAEIHVPTRTCPSVFEVELPSAYELPSR